MSCKYCELKRRKDDDVEWIAGEDWESEIDDGGYICPHDDGFRMLVYYDARFACAAVDNIKYCPFCGAELTMPKGPLIKDESDPERAEKIRKALRAWAELNSIKSVAFEDYDDENIYFIDRDYEPQIWFSKTCIAWELDDGQIYTITDLCGEEEEE